MRYVELREAGQQKPKHLYHGTAKKYVPSIMAKGIEPRTGSYVTAWYGRGSKPLIFAAERRHIESCILAMFAAISEIIELSASIELDEFLQHAALIVLPSDSFQRRGGKSDKSHPPQVEARDWYSLVPVRPTKILVDAELRPLIAYHFRQARVGWFGEPSEFF